MRILWQVALMAVFAVNGVSGMMFDNRFLGDTLGHRPYLAPDTETSFQVQPFFLTADHSYDSHGRDAGLFEYGDVPYGVRYLDSALLTAGEIDKSFVRSDWQSRLTRGPYAMEGLLDAYGVAFSFFRPFSENCGLGFRTGVLKLNSCFNLVRNVPDFEQVVFGPGDETDLQTLQKNIDDALGIKGYVWNDSSMTDTEVYFRLFSVHDYAYLCRLVDAGVSFGVVAPTAKKRSLCNPASISAGGNGHWAVYVEGNVDAILKQNVRASLLLRLQQRLRHTGDYRMPAGKEPTMFGAIVGPAEVKPGFTFLLSPYVVFERISGGFGIYLGYSLVKHLCDAWIDCRCDKSVQAKLDVLRTESPWASERVHCGLFYDLDLGLREYRYTPIISLNVDIPVSWMIAERSAATYGVSLGIEMHF